MLGTVLKRLVLFFVCYNVDVRSDICRSLTQIVIFSGHYFILVILENRQIGRTNIIGHSEYHFLVICIPFMFLYSYWST